MKVKTAVIAAAGFGSRFLPYVKDIPKEMLPIIDRPSIQFSVEECIDAGMENIIVVVRGGNSLIEDYFTKPAKDVHELLASQGRLERFDQVERVLGFKGLKFINQDMSLPYGNGSPIYSAKHLLDPNEPFVAMFGDDMFMSNTEKGGVAQIVEFYNQYGNGTDGVIAGEQLPVEEIIGKLANVKFKEFDEVGKHGVMDYQIEKPTREQLVSDVMTYGRMVLTPKVFDYLTPTATGLANELWLQDAIAKMAKTGTVRVKVMDGKWITTGDPERYFSVVVRYYLRHEKYGPKAKEFLQSLSL